MGKLSQFLNNRYLISPQDYTLEDYQHSDFGRKYGWWVIVDGTRVASLEYKSFLEEPVHLYQLHILDPAFSKIGKNPEKWASQDVLIESRYAEGYLKKGLDMAPVGKGMIVVQNLFIPEPDFKRQHAKIDLFHKELLGNAQQNRNEKESSETENHANEASTKTTPDPIVKNTTSPSVSPDSTMPTLQAAGAEPLSQPLLSEPILQESSKINLEQDTTQNESFKLLGEITNTSSNIGNEIGNGLNQATAPAALAPSVSKHPQALAAPTPPDSSAVTQEPWQSKLGGKPRLSHLPQQPNQRVDDDSITKL